MPQPKPVTKIELSDKHPRLRMFIVVTLIAIATAAIVYGTVNYFHSASGWQSISIKSGTDTTIAGEFDFEYLLGEGKSASYVERRKLIEIYSEAMLAADRIYDSENEFEGIANLCYLNQHVNEAVSVDSELYDALKILTENDVRAIFLAPLYRDYRSLFLSNNDEEAKQIDPTYDSEQADYATKICGFAKSADDISLEFGDNNKVTLKVSSEYMQYLNAVGIKCYVDMVWLKNAFVIDYVSDKLIEEGFVLGHIASYDGYFRNLDNSGSKYAYQILNRYNNVITPAADMIYDRAMAFVTFRNYPANSGDGMRFYIYEDNTIVTPYISGETGLCQSAINDLTLYSSEVGCVPLAIAASKAYIAENFDAERITYNYIFCEERVIKCNDKNVNISNVYDKNDIKYIYK